MGNLNLNYLTTRKIILLLSTFVFAVGAFAQGGFDCSKEVLEGGETAWGDPHVYIYASDFRVEENQPFLLNSLTFNVITTPEVPVEGVTVYFYEDTGAGPGEEIGMQEITEFDVISIGDYAGRDHSTIALDLIEPVLFDGEVDAATTYWVGLMIDYPEDQTSFIEVTDQFDTDNATYFYDFQYGTWTNGADPMWPIGGFFHAMVSLYGECSTLGVDDFNKSSITHFTQNKQLFIQGVDRIQEVTVYNILGQKMISEQVDSTSGIIDLSALNAGVYLAQADVDGNVKTFKFVVK